MDEHFVKHIVKEEEFLDSFCEITTKIKELLNNEWIPNYSSNDPSRRNDEYFLKNGELRSLVFDSASVYQKGGNFSKAIIILQSSFRLISIQVKKLGNEYIAEILKDEKQ